MIINRVLGKVVHRTAKDFFDTNLSGLPAGMRRGANFIVLNADCRKPFSNDFLLDTSRAEDLTSLFMASESSISPILDLSSCKKISHMFHQNFSGNFLVIRFSGDPELTNCYQAFAYCSSLQTIEGNFHFAKNAYISSMFTGCESLKSLPALNVSDVNTSYRGGKDFSPSMTKIDTSRIRLRDGTEVESWCCKVDIDFGKSHLSHDDVMYLITHLIEEGDANKKHLKLSAWSLGLLTDEEKAIATNKGWSLVENA